MTEMIELKVLNTEEINLLKVDIERSTKPDISKLKFKWFKNEIFFLSLHLIILLTYVQIKFWLVNWRTKAFYP